MAQMSQAQYNYLKKRRNDSRLVHMIRILIFILFLVLWQVSSQTGIIDPFIFSSPKRVFSTFIEMLQQNGLLTHIEITLSETLASFLLVILLGVCIAILLWCSPKAAKILEPYLVVLNSLPKSALAPLLIVWLGANQKTIIIAGMSVSIFGTILNLYTGFLQVDSDKLKLIETLGGTKWDCLFKVVLPTSVPLILSVMKVNIGLCLVGVIIGEFIGARQGIGYLIIYSSQVFKMDWMIMSIILLCILAMILYGILSLLEKKLLKGRSR